MKDKVYIAAATSCSIRLMMRRAYWSNSHGYPLINGYRIDPRHAARNSREAYQAEVSAWFDALDPDARKFLGPDYAAMAGRRERKDNDA